LFTLRLFEFRTYGKIEAGEAFPQTLTESWGSTSKNGNIFYPSSTNEKLKTTANYAESDIVFRETYTENCSSLPKSATSEIPGSVMTKLFEAYDTMMKSGVSFDDNLMSNAFQEFEKQTRKRRLLHVEVFTVPGPLTKNTSIESLIIKYDVQEVVTMRSNNQLLQIESEEGYEMIPIYVENPTKPSDAVELDHSRMIGAQNQMNQQQPFMPFVAQSETEAWTEYKKHLEWRTRFFKDVVPEMPRPPPAPLHNFPTYAQQNERASNLFPVLFGQDEIMRIPEQNYVPYFLETKHSHVSNVTDPTFVRSPVSQNAEWPH